MRNETVASGDASEFGEELGPIRILHVAGVDVAEDSEVPETGASKGRDADLIAAFAGDEIFDGAAHHIPFFGWDDGLVFEHWAVERDVADDAVGVDVCRLFGVEVNSYTEGTWTSL